MSGHLWLRNVHDLIFPQRFTAKQATRARLLFLFQLLFLISVFLFILPLAFSAEHSVRMGFLILAGACLLCILVLFLLTRAGYLSTASWLQVGTVWFAPLFHMLTSGGLYSDAFIGWPMAIVLAGLLLGRGGSLFVASLSLAGGVLITVLWQQGKIGPAIGRQPIEQLALTSVIISLLALMQWLGSKRSENALEKQTERMRLIFKTAPVFISIIDTDGKFQFINQVEDSYSRENIIGKATIYDFLPAESQAASREYVSQALRSDTPVVYDLQGFGNDGSMEWYANRLTRFNEDGQTRLLLISSNITARKAAEARLVQLAHEDPLTGLANRHAIMQLVSKSIAREIPFALLFIDLDHFKTINDTLGHDIGDLLLVHIATELKETLGEDNVLARLGGDEFLGLILAERGETEVALRGRVERVASRMIAQAATPHVIQNSELFLSASLGISLYPQDGGATSELIKFADLAMYHAKSRGRADFAFYEKRFSEVLDERVRIDRMLRSAVERNELALHYQPLVDVKDGKIRAAEALLRWKPGDSQAVSPTVFIPIAEDTGLIHSISEWVIESVCANLRDWKNQYGMAPRVAINISARQLERVHFADRTLATLKRYGLATSDIELELTETSLLSTTAATMPEMVQLAEAGVKLVIDDFGTGYSSLSYLKKLPVQSLKIDRSFVADIGKDTNDEAIIRAVLAMASSLGLTVVAEGVEFQAQLDFMTHLGCDTIQGFFYSEALPPAEFIKRWQELFA